ncbi:MAG: ABC transporter permease [Anaerolineae bacterium]|nr:ABC transporter permease [Anaerolineae bacterium]
MDVLLDLVLIGLSNGGIIALNAVAVTVIYCAVRTLNLAHGDVYALSSVMTMMTLRSILPLDGPPTWAQLIIGLILSIISTISFGVIFSMLIEFLGFRLFRGQSRLAPIIATLGLSFMLYQLALVWRKLLPTFNRGEHRSVPGVDELPRDVVPHIFSQIDVFQALGIQTNSRFDIKDLFIIVCAPIVAYLVHLLLNKTKVGRAIRACAQDSIAAQMVGVNLNGAIRAAFAIGGALAGVAAFIFAITVERPVANHGAQSGLIAFTAAILGGIGNPLGALVSGLLIGMFAAFSDYLLDGRWTPALIYLLLVGLLMWRPSGLSPEERTGELSQQTGDVVVLNATRASTTRTMSVLLNLVPLALLYPLIVPLIGEYYLPVVNSFLIYVVLALGLTVLLGFAGVLDVGYALNFAIGAYLMAYLTGPAMAWRDQLLGFVPDGIIVFAIIIIVTGCLGMVKGWLTARMRIDYLAIATLALSLMMRDVLKNSGAGGVGGFSAIPPPTLFGVRFDSFTMQYLLVLGVVALIIVGSYRLLDSRVGRAMAAMREDEYAAQSSGVSIGRYKSISFFIGDSIAGLAGGLYAAMLSFAEPGLADFQVSVMVLSMVAIGGIGNISGAVFGVFSIMGLDRIVIPFIQGLMGDQPFVQFTLRELNFLLFGLALYFSVFFSRKFKFSKDSDNLNKKNDRAQLKKSNVGAS